MKKTEMKNKEEKKVTKIALNILFWTLLTVIAIIWIIDFTKVQKEEKPEFCIIQKTHKFEDGTVEECIGLGYKIYEYKRESIHDTSQFSPFYIKMKK